MADWKFLGGITALGGLIGFFGAKTIDVKKLPAGEKAVLTGASTGATMEGLDLALGAEGCDHVPILGDIIEETDDGVIAEMTCELCGAEGTHYMDSDYNDLGSEWDAESYSAEGVTLLMTLLTKARKEASDYEMGYDYQWKILNMRGNSYDIDLSMSRLESRTELMSKVQWTLSNLIDELVEESLDLSAESSSEQKFRHKKTGEIATQISLMDIKNWEKLEAESFSAEGEHSWWSANEYLNGRWYICAKCGAEKAGGRKRKPNKAGCVGRKNAAESFSTEFEEKLCGNCDGHIESGMGFTIPPYHSPHTIWCESCYDYHFEAESLKRDSCCCAATKSNPSA